MSGLSGARFPAGGAFGSLAKSSPRVSFGVAYSGLRRQITTWRWLSDFPDAYGIRQKKRWIADALRALGNSDYSPNSHRLWQSADIFLQSYRHTLDLPVLDRHGSALFRGCFDFIRKTACLPKPSLFHLWSQIHPRWFNWVLPRGMAVVFFRRSIIALLVAFQTMMFLRYGRPGISRHLSKLCQAK